MKFSEILDNYILSPNQMVEIDVGLASLAKERVYKGLVSSIPEYLKDYNIFIMMTISAGDNCMYITLEEDN